MRILNLILSVLLCGLLFLDIHNGEAGFMLLDFAIPFWIAGFVSAIYFASSVHEIFFESGD